MKLLCLLLLLAFVNIRHVRGNGIRVPLSIYEHLPEGYNREDVDYIGTISIGTPPQRLRVLFLFTYYSHAIQVRSSYCNSSVCRDKNRSSYDHKISKTFRSHEADFDGRITRRIKRSAIALASDTITIGDNQMKDVMFLVDPELKECDYKPCDGVVGLAGYGHILQHCKKLGRECKFSLHIKNCPGLLDLLDWSGAVPPLWRTSMTDLYSFELMLCGEDKTKFQGNLVYLTLQDHIGGVANDVYEYVVQMESVLLHHNDKNDSTTEFQNNYFVLNPHSSYIRGPAQHIMKILEVLGHIFEVDCKTVHTLPSITFRTAARDFTLTGTDYITQLTQNGRRVCTLPFMRMPHYHRDNIWMIGNVFTRKFYTVFDMETEKVGFADSIHGPAYSVR